MEYAPTTTDKVLDNTDIIYAQQAMLRDRCQSNLDRILADYPALSKLTLTQLLNSELDPDICCHVQHWGGGAYAHELSLESLADANTTQPSPLLQGAIDRAFGSTEGLCRTLQNAAPGNAGFLWLSSDREGNLQVNRTFQYATPLPLTPLLALPSRLLPSPGVCERLNFSTASRRYAGVLACRSPNLYL